VKKPLLIIGILLYWNLHSQVDSTWVNDVRMHFESPIADTIAFYNESVMPYDFEITTNNEIITPNYYEVDFSKATLYLLSTFYDTYDSNQLLHIYFKPFPNFLTDNGQIFDNRNVFPNLTAAQAISLEIPKQNNLRGIPFDGLETQGNLIRGITVGNNQDAVLNSALDLKIEGKLSSKIKLSAHLNDTNIPIQENGYSQELKDLDRVYIEMTAANWNLTAGDMMLRDTTDYYLNFNKKIQGVSVDINTAHWNFLSAAGLVKGLYSYQEFQGKEGNQGPYKLQGKNGELYIFIIQNSERVYINGILQKKGENADYLIDYNTGEIVFTPTNPISADSRIYIEYQYSDQNYTRLITKNTLKYNDNKITTSFSFYKESDLKNQSITLQLSEQQKEELRELNSSTNVLWSEYAIQTTFNPNKILYRKVPQGTVVIFEYSVDPTEILYDVGFTYFGTNQGDYKVLEYLAVGKKMIFVGENQGDYRALVPITTPNSLQIYSLNTDYHPNNNTAISTELAMSNHQYNLFSQNKTNSVPALKMRWEETLFNKKWKGNLVNQLDYLHQDFKTPEKLYTIDFSRDWNLTKVSGNQSLFSTQFNMENEKYGKMYLQYEKLSFVGSYRGNRWTGGSAIDWKHWQWEHQSSYLHSFDNLNESRFSKNFDKITFKKNKWWTSIDTKLEQNKIWNSTPHTLNTNSFKTLNYNATFGVGDTTNVYTKLGIQIINSDSIKSNKLNLFYKSKSAWQQTQLIRNENAQLGIYSYVRKSDFINKGVTTTYSNQINYNQNLWNKVFQFQTEYQNGSGQIAQQDFNYIETEPGQGYYTWIDYNENGIKELDEFEIAKFQDQAKYLRFSLPNITFLPTQESKISQMLAFNPAELKGGKKIYNFLSHFRNQTQIMAQNAKPRTNKFYLNPFDLRNNALHHHLSLQNQLYYNQGKDYFTTGYLFNKSNRKLLQNDEVIYQNLSLHQLIFQHLIEEQWEIGFEGTISKNVSTNDIYLNKNFTIHTIGSKPNLSYFFNKTHWIKATYLSEAKENIINKNEKLNTQKLIVNYQYNGKNDTQLMMDAQWIQNDFSGEENSAIGYQMLEGLSKGKNATWTVLWTKKLNDFLYLNLSYNGRVNETSPVIHNGSVQMRAQF